jgi:hypothetical protein
MARETSRLAKIRDRVWPVVILAVSLVLHLAFVLEFVAHPIGKLPWVDEGAYWTRAQAILGGAWLPDRPFYQDPLFPYLLAVFMRGVGTSVPSLRIVLACIGSLTPLAVYWAGRRGLGRSEGIVAGLLTAACGPLLFADGLLEKEGLAALGAALALGLTAWAGAQESRTWRAVLAGAAWGVVALLRANALVMAPLGALWLVVADRRELTFGHRWRRAAVYFVGFALSIAPVTAVNALVTHPPEVILTTWQGGANFYIGNGPDATGTYSAPEFVEANPAREADDFATEARQRAGRPLSYAGVSRFWLREGLRHWRQAPVASIRLLGHKFRLLLHDFEIPDNHDMEFIRLVAAPRLSWAPVSFGVLLALAVVGLCPGQRTPFWGFVGISTIAGLCTTALFFVVGRYRVPWIPGLALLAASGIVDTFRCVASRKLVRASLRIALLVTPAAVLAWSPMPDPAPDRWSHAEIELALAYLSEGRLEPAINAFDDARALSPGAARRVEVLLSNGPVHDRLAELVQLRLNAPASDGGVTTLQTVRWFRQLSETRAESRRRLDALLRSQPDDPALLREDGAWWLGESDDPKARERARDAWIHASQTATSDAQAEILLAVLSHDSRFLVGPRNRQFEPYRERLQLARAILRSRAGSIGAPWWRRGTQ